MNTAKIHLTDSAEFVVTHFTILNSGWVSFLRDGKKFFLPASQIAIVEANYAPTED